jgi:hypothetical protein
LSYRRYKQTGRQGDKETRSMIESLLVSLSPLLLVLPETRFSYDSIPA